MFNEQIKNKAIKDLENANRQYMIGFRKTIRSMEALYRSRTRAVRTILNVERYVSNLANKPRGYEIKIGEINIRYTEFNNKIDEIRRLEKKESQLNYNGGMGVGILAGVGSTALAPTAAMAIAMTFGTTSTGTAIASLSGAAATNAALAWLGGGALVSGGAGIAGGKALLSMAGPIGWALGGTVLAGNIFLNMKHNADIAKEAENSTRVILKEKERMAEIDIQVQSWEKETTKLSVGILKKLMLLRNQKDYAAFSVDKKKELAILMNMTELLSKKLGDTIA